MFRKPGKLPIHWKSKVPSQWKQNCIFEELHRAKRITGNFNQEIESIRRYLNASYPRPFMTSTLRSFQNMSLDDNDKLIPDYLFEERKKSHIQIAHCANDDKICKKFIAKLNKFTNNNYAFSILWKTRKIKSLFSIKDKNIYHSNIVYEGKWPCEANNYIGESISPSFKAQSSHTFSRGKFFTNQPETPSNIR